MGYTVGQMAALLGIPASTLRYYDKEGLLPFVERSAGGIRIFQQRDYEWLTLIECLKQTGMPIKDIRTYIDMAMEGDATIEGRSQLFLRQREAIRQKIQDLQQTLEVLDFKCWYYETAKAAGTTAVPRNLPPEQIPAPHRAAYERLHHAPKQLPDA